MTEVRITFCDVCNQQQSVLAAEGRGYVMYPAHIAVTDLGWKRKRDGSGIEKHICAQCLEEQTEK